MPDFSLDDAVGASLQGSATSIRNNMVQALPVNPDAEAQTRRMATAAGVPLDTARNMPDVVKTQAQMAGFDADHLAAKYPYLAQYLGSDANNAKLIHDDIPATANVEQHVTALGQPPQPPEPTTSIGESLANAPMAVLQGLGGAYSKMNLSLLRGVKWSLGGSSAADWWQQNMIAPQEANQPAFQIPQNAGFPEKAANVAGSLTGTLSQIMLSGFGGTPAALPATAGVGETVLAATQHGVKSMALPAVSDAIATWHDVLEKGGDTAAAIRGAVAQYLTSTAMGIAPMSMAGRLATRVASGAVVGTVQGEVNRQIMNAALPDSMFQPYSGEGVALNAIAGGVLGVAGPHSEASITDMVRGTYADAAKADRAQLDAQTLGGLADAVATAKFRDRDPDAFKQFVQNAAQDGPVPAVFIDAKQLADSLHQSNISLDELASKMPEVAQQLPDAITTGSQVRIPVEDFATHIAGGPLQAGIMDHLRTDPDGMTKAESDAFYQSHADDLKTQADAITQGRAADQPFQDSRQQVHDEVLRQLNEANRFPADVNQAYASLHRDFYTTMAERAGVMPHELFAQHPVNIGAENVAGEALTQGPKGAYSPETNTIAMLKGADLSTFLHETGHHFLDTMEKMASFPDAPQGIKDDMAQALKFMGHDSLESWKALDLSGKRDGHESFARGFESYLMEGKAPNFEMRTLFQRFRSWLTNVYRSLSSLNVELTPEVRGVFDRMIASEDSIRQAETARAYMPLFDSPEKAGVSPEEWAKYQNLGKDATNTAIEALSSKTLKDMAYLDRSRSGAVKELAKDAAEKRKAIMRDVEEQVNKQPVYEAGNFLKRGDGVAENHRLNIADLKEMLPDGGWEKLGYGKYGMLGDGGLHPDIVAEKYGFADGKALVDALLAAPKRSDVVRGLTDQAMLEKHGEIATPEALARTADDLIHNDVRTRFIATELKALNKAIGSVRDLTKAAKDVAENTIAAQRIRDVTPGQYLNAETRAGKEAMKRLAAGDTEGAAFAKREQLLNNQLARAATDALAKVQKDLNYLKRFDRASTREKIDLEYRDQIDSLLDRHDLRQNVSGVALDKREALLAFVERQAANGYEPNIPEKLLNEAERTHYKNMATSDFDGLVDAVKSIEHLGRLKDKLLDQKELRDISALAQEVKETTAELPQRGAETNRGLSRIDAAFLNAKAAGRSMTSSLLKMEQMMDWLDNRNPNGVLNRVVFRRISDAGVKENDLLKRVKADMDVLADKHLADVTKDARTIFVADKLIDGLTGEAQRFTKKQMLMLAGNMGNESNVAKLTKGEGWAESDVWDFLHAHMKKADWDFVAGMGKALESLWPEKLAMSRRLGNTNPDKIAPRPFETPHGDYEGWYWPMIYDPARAQDVHERGAKAGDALFENIYSKPGTDTGRLNTRSEAYARPILLDLDAIPRVIKDEIHDIAFREAVIDADKFLANPVVAKSIKDTLSQQHYDQLRPWLQSIANDGKSSTEAMRGLKFFNDVAHFARTRATIVGLGFRVSTAAVHGMSAGAESVAELGAKWMGVGMKDFANPAQWSANKDFIFERSGEMRHRMNEGDRDVREYLREIDVHMMDPATSAIQRGADTMKAHAYTMIAGLDMASAMPTWMGAYHKGMAEAESGGLGMSEQDAIYFADKTVRNAHGGTGVKDMAAVQRGPEFMKLFTMFYTFWNHNINRLMDTAKLASSAATWKDSNLAASVILRTLVYTIGVQAIHGYFHPPKEGAEEESWLKWASKEFLASAFSGIPIARDIATHFLSGRDYSATPAASLIKAMGDTGTDALNALTGKEASDKVLKHSIAAAGYVLGLPTGQASSTTQFLWDVHNGVVHPETIAEWYRGLSTGNIKSH